MTKTFTQLLAHMLAWAAQARAQGLDLGEVDASSVVEAGSQYPYAGWAMAGFGLYALLGVVILGFLIFKRKTDWRPPFTLKDLPDSAKTIVTLAMSSYALVHLFAVIEVYLKCRVAYGSAQEYFFYMQLPKLVATSHAHFFGHGTMYALTGAIFLFSTLSEKWKVIFICMAMSAGLLDVPSWWAIKYAGGHFEIFSALAGMMSAVGWGFMASRILYELWIPSLRRTQ